MTRHHHHSIKTVLWSSTTVAGKNNFKFESEKLQTFGSPKLRKKLTIALGPSSENLAGPDEYSELGPSAIVNFFLSLGEPNVCNFSDSNLKLFFPATVVDDHRTVLMEWWWCLVTCSRPQVVLERSCGCGWVGGLINGTHKCYNMIMMRVWGREWAEKMCQKYTKNY